jgi:putative transposase
MPGRAAKVVITERQQEALQTMTRSSTCAQAVAQRARMILLAFDGQDNQQIADRIGCERHAVGTWRRRWVKAFARLVLIECGEQESVFRRALQDVLSDGLRCGCPGKFTPEQITQVLAVACEPPEKSGRPVSHWTPRELAAEVVKRDIVPSISARHVGRFLKDGRPAAASHPLLAQRTAERPGGLSAAGGGSLRLLPGRPAAPARRGPAHGLDRRNDWHSGAGTHRPN